MSDAQDAETTMSDLVIQLRRLPAGNDPEDQWRLTPVWLLDNAADHIERLEVKVDRLTSRGIEDMRFQIQELEAEVARLKQWFSDNAAILATHNIGGYSFEDKTP